jgi:hypothetical protein
MFVANVPEYFEEVQINLFNGNFMLNCVTASVYKQDMVDSKYVSSLTLVTHRPTPTVNECDQIPERSTLFRC